MHEEKMENNEKIEEMKISKPRMILKLVRLFLWTIRKRRWYLPDLNEITADELYERLNSNQPPLIIDTRDEASYNGTGDYKDEKYGHIPNSQLIPLFELTSHFEDLQPFREKEIVTLCPGGGASLVAVDVMVEAGFTDVKSLKGGIRKWYKKGYPLIRDTTTKNNGSPYEVTQSGSSETRHPLIEGNQPLDETYIGEVHHTLDARGLICPRPILKSKKKLKTLKMGQVLEILTTDPGSKRDIPAWAHVTGQELIASEERSPKEFRFIVKRMK
ncbi:MAG: sulfurtransferase TusA family protein [Promethearchaeota archaeon]